MKILALDSSASIGTVALCEDEKLDVFDLCLMKNKLIKTTAD